MKNHLDEVGSAVFALLEAGGTLEGRRELLMARNTALIDAVFSEDADSIIVLLEAGTNAQTVEIWIRRLPLHLWASADSRKVAYQGVILKDLPRLAEYSTRNVRFPFSHLPITNHP